jgi:5-methylcytosine-specific restriction endonuclease McrA
MNRDEYKQLRKTVFYRDNYKCVICASNKNIQMDHIKEWCNYPELRYEVSNCRTLCLSCHKKN